MIATASIANRRFENGASSWVPQVVHRSSSGCDRTDATASATQARSSPPLRFHNA